MAILPTDPVARLLAGLSIIMIVLQLAGQYAVFVQVPEKQKEILGRVDSLQRDLSEFVGRGDQRYVEVQKDMSWAAMRLSNLEAVVKDMGVRLDGMPLLSKDLSKLSVVFDRMERVDEDQWKEIRRHELEIRAIEQRGNLRSGKKEEQE